MPPASERLTQIKPPTLIIVGANDTAATAASADRLASLITGAQKVVIAGAGHMVNMDAPAEFNRAGHQLQLFDSKEPDFRSQIVNRTSTRAWRCGDTQNFNPCCLRVSVLKIKRLFDAAEYLTHSYDFDARAVARTHASEHRVGHRRALRVE